MFFTSDIDDEFDVGWIVFNLLYIKFDGLKNIGNLLAPEVVVKGVVQLGNYLSPVELKLFELQVRIKSFINFIVSNFDNKVKDCV